MLRVWEVSMILSAHSPLKGFCKLKILQMRASVNKCPSESLEGAHWVCVGWLVGGVVSKVIESHSHHIKPKNSWDWGKISEMFQESTKIMSQTTTTYLPLAICNLFMLLGTLFLVQDSCFFFFFLAFCFASYYFSLATWFLLHATRCLLPDLCFLLLATGYLTGCFLLFVTYILLFTSWFLLLASCICFLVLGSWF